MMIPVTQLRSGRTFQEKGEPFVVLKYEHVKMGRGTATIKVRVRNLKTGAIRERVFISGAQVEEVKTAKRKLQYLYHDRDVFFFMDPQSFEQFEVKAEAIGSASSFLQEGAQVEILFLDEEPLALELPPKMKIKVAQTTPGVKGNSATNVFKEAILENGLKIKIPLFIKEGEEVVVDTRTGEYVERAKD